MRWDDPSVTQLKAPVAAHLNAILNLVVAVQSVFSPPHLPPPRPLPTHTFPWDSHTASVSTQTTLHKEKVK